MMLLETDRMSGISDAELYRRNIDTVVASFEAYAHGSAGASVQRVPGAAIAVFPTGPERGVYNNAVLDRDLSGPQRFDALDAIESAYRLAGIERFAIWIHETDAAARAELERRSFTFDSSTRAMSMPINELRVPGPQMDLIALDWPDYLRLFGLPDGLLHHADLSVFHLLVARLDGEIATTALAFDHCGDCGIYNVETLDYARRRGLGTALTALQVANAQARGCETASLQSTPMAERVYAAVGFRDLGRILEFVPQTSASDGPLSARRANA
jgi:hypothetical protein